MTDAEYIQAIATRFWARVDIRADRECWLWRGGVDEGGYGRFHLNGGPAKAHVVSYTLSRGSVPGGSIVRHACDVRNCVNPYHLLHGTSRDNSRDMVERGRTYSGERHHSAKLTMADARRMRELHAAGQSEKEIAQTFSVTPSTVRRVVSGRSWREQPAVPCIKYGDTVTVFAADTAPAGDPARSDFCGFSASFSVEPGRIERPTSALPVRRPAPDSSVKQDTAERRSCVHHMCDPTALVGAAACALDRPRTRRRVGDPSWIWGALPEAAPPEAAP